MIEVGGRSYSGLTYSHLSYLLAIDPTRGKMALHTHMTARYLASLPMYDTVKPYNLQIEPPQGIPRNNIHVTEYANIPVHDCRGDEASFTLEKQGFQFSSFPLTDSLPPPEGDLDLHLRHAEDFLRELLGAQEVRVFEHKASTNHIAPLSRQHFDFLSSFERMIRASEQDLCSRERFRSSSGNPQHPFILVRTLLH